MEMVDPSREEPSTHISNQMLSNVPHGGVVVFYRLERFKPVGRDMRLSPVCPPEERRISLDGHDTRNNGNCDALGAALVDPIDEVVCIVEHLGNDKRASRINLLFQMVDQDIHIPVVI